MPTSTRTAKRRTVRNTDTVQIPWFLHAGRCGHRPLRTSPYISVYRHTGTARRPFPTNFAVRAVGAPLPRRPKPSGLERTYDIPNISPYRFCLWASQERLPYEFDRTCPVRAVGVDAYIDPNREAADGAQYRHRTNSVVPARGTMWASSPTNLIALQRSM